MLQLAISKRVVQDERILSLAGYTIYAPVNISEVDALMAATGRKQQSAMLSLRNNDFTHANAEFLFLKHKGEVVAGARVKFVDLQDETFESHQRRAVQQWYGTKEDQIISIARPLNDLIKGKHVYVGELEFREDHRGRVSVTTAFIRIMLALSFLKWPDINCAYCILPEKHRRLAVDYGFDTTVRRAYRWREPIPGGRLHDWLVAVSSRNQLIHDLTEGYWGQAPQILK